MQLPEYFSMDLVYSWHGPRNYMGKFAVNFKGTVTSKNQTWVSSVTPVAMEQLAERLKVELKPYRAVSVTLQQDQKIELPPIKSQMINGTLVMDLIEDSQKPF
jgi:hypothetical protein